MREVVAHAERGGPVLGICNGFQIACEAGLLPGALLRNESLKFVCSPTRLRVENAETLYTHRYERGQLLDIPIAHGEGRYTADDDTLDRLEGEGQVIFRYVDASGQPTAEANPNGSARNIAGIVSAGGNVLGMMPHPERAVDPVLGSTDGLALFQGLLDRVAA
jgi:phosphoribosylformylglycinamidine synthase